MPAAAAFQPAFAPRPAPARAGRSEAALAPTREDAKHRELKRMLWLYFWLLIFEGALRKWTFSGVSKFFLIIRDPVVLGIYFLALRDRVFPLNFGMFWIGALATAGMALMFAQIFIFQFHLVVAAYGWRSYFLHLPLVFLLPKVLTFADLQKLGRWILMLSIPMALLMTAQFELPPDHILNLSTIDNKMLLLTAGGHVRPPGTFSFITGPAQFYPWVIAFLFAALSWRAAYPVWLRLGAAVCAVLVQPVSGSRVLVMGCAIVVLVAATGFFRSEQIRRTLGFMLVLGSIALPLLALTPVFQDSLEMFQLRWNMAAESEGQGSAVRGMTKRTYDSFADAFRVIPETPPLGEGMGMGTNVGAQLMDNRVGFQLAESEWPRLVQETGPLFGLALIFTRLGLTIFLFVRAWRAFREDHNILAWLMFAACGPAVLYGSTAQPTALGFMCFGAGLTLAAAKNPTPTFRAADQPWL